MTPVQIERVITLIISIMVVAIILIGVLVYLRKTDSELNDSVNGYLLSNLYNNFSRQL